MVEAAGIEPASREQKPKEPTCLVGVLDLGIEDTRRQVSSHPSLQSFAFLHRYRERLSHLHYTRLDLKREESPADVAALSGQCVVCFCVCV